MSVFIWKTNLSKIYFSSCYYIATNSKQLINNGLLVNSCKNTLKGQEIPANCILRRCSSAPSRIKPYKSKRKYATNWKLERLLGWSMIGLIPTTFIIDSKELEFILSSIALLHTYWGCQSVCSDYLRSNVVGKLMPVIVRLSIVFLFLTSMAGSYKLIYEDVGVINMIKKLWSIRGRNYIPSEHLQIIERKQESIFEMFSKK